MANVAKEIEFTPLEEFDFWLSEMEDKLVATTAKKPGNRVEACQLLATGQKLQTECRGREIPEELHEEGDPKAEELADRYHALLSAADGNVAKTETLCVCWDKLNSDLTELKSALSSGGAGKSTISRLESSMAKIKEMFKERAQIVENLTPAGDY